MPARERDPEIDFIRGVAILGLIFVNIHLIASADYLLGFLGLSLAPGGWQNVLFAMVAIFFEGKWITSLAFLLGAGIAMQQVSRRGTSGSTKWFSIRRYGFLLVLGLVHAWFIWWGDILFFYALLGLLIAAMSGLKGRTRVIIALICMAFSGVGMGSLFFLIGDVDRDRIEWLKENALTDDEEVLEELALDESDMETLFWLAGHRSADFYYRSESYTASLSSRFLDWWVSVFAFGPFIPFYFGIALLGHLAFTSGWLAQLIRGQVSLVFPVGVLALVLTIIAVLVSILFPERTLGFVGMLFSAILLAPVVAALYFPVLGKIAGHSRNSLVASGILAVGRAPLSNYLFQSVAATFIFYGYGLGWFGLLSYAEILAVACAIIVLQLILTTLWLRVFAFGPMEWIWRTVTYLKLPPVFAAHAAPTTPSAL